MAKKFVAVCRGVYLVGKTTSSNGIVYFRKMVDGKRTIKRATLQGALAIDARGRPTKALKAEAANWSAMLLTGMSAESQKASRTMTIGEWLNQYELAAQYERMRSGRPSESTVKNVTKGVRKITEALGLQQDDKVDELTADKIDMGIMCLIKTGKKSITASTYASNLQMMAARWTVNYYRQAGYEPVKIDMPPKRSIRPERYNRPSEETLAKIKAWYEEIWGREDKRLWLMATMMLQFAMRNGDIRRATEQIFEKRGDGRIIMRYTPNKTEKSSGRKVAWPVSQALWDKIQTANEQIKRMVDEMPSNGWWCAIKRENKLIPGFVSVQERINEDMRKMMPGKTKSSYELRKICIDHIYQKYGAEKASAISGDDIKTLSYYYADPSQAVEMAGVDVNDLL